MTEDKQTKKWSYSTLGKVVRGLFCMLTFCVFIAGLAFTVYGVYQYGDTILWESGGSYFDMDRYTSDLEGEVVSLLSDVESLIQYKNMENGFSIIDVGSHSIHYYDLGQLMEDVKKGKVKFPNSLEKLEPYRFFTAKCDCDFADLSSVKRFLASDAAKGSYIYLETEDFIGLFLENGISNAGLRFSKDFSKEAYFIFDNEEKIIKGQDADMEAHSYTIQAGEDNTDVKLDEETETHNYDIQDAGYAVYDPAQGVFYSTWDEYFNLNNTYIYKGEDLADVILNKISGSGINSVVIPMLWSYNYSWENLENEFLNTYDGYLNATHNMENRKESGFLYYITNTNSLYTNVTDKEEIESLEYSYEIRGKEAVENTKDITKSALYEKAAGFMDDFPEDTVFCFGFAPERSGNDRITRHYNNYNFTVNFIWYFLFAAVVSFLLLIVQAVWLICTTGRLEKGTKEVILNGYDRLITEVWFLLNIGILSVSIVWPITIYVGFGIDISRIESFIILVVIAALPFAICFMELTLSFARRIKAHNLRSRLYFGKIGSRVLNKIREFCQSRKDVEKILSIFVCYVILEVVSIKLMKSQKVPGLIMFIALQAVAFIVVYCMVRDVKILTKRISQITSGNLDYKCPIASKYSLLRELDNGINHIGDGLKAAVETSLKDERMKTELITNVSHDLKTPLTSIINYVDLLKKEKMPTKEAIHYLEVLESKSHRLKQLTEDLVEAAKANSGNIELEKMPLAFDELMKQAIGEFEDKFNKKNLAMVAHYPEETVLIMADGRRMYRIIENILQNAYKYALEGTRIYADLSNNQSVVTLTLKNVSAAPLNISPEELMERFTRGDESRTTEGSGLGLSIAKDLTKLQDGTFDIVLDGDLFKVIISFPEYKK